jgi:hypothetical protein
MPIHDADGEDLSANVIGKFTEIIDWVVKDSIPLDSDHKILESLKSLGTDVGKKLKSIGLVINQKEFDITPSFSKTIEGALERVESCIGTVEGSLEQINVRGPKKHFTIYPEIGPKQVRCIFPEHLHQEAIKSIERKVEVSGVLRFKPGQPFPHEILVQDITVQSEDEETPTFEKLLGIAQIEDVRSSEDIVRDDRNEWH